MCTAAGRIGVPSGRSLFFAYELTLTPNLNIIDPDNYLLHFREVGVRHLAMLVLVSLISATVAFAGDPKPLTQTGNKALLFDLGGLATLAAGNYGGGLGAKYYLSQDLAIRLSFGFNTSTQTTKNTQPTPLPANRLAESKLTSTEFTVGPAIVYNIAKSSTVAAYVGGMLSLTTSSDKRDGNDAIDADFNVGQAYRLSSTAWGFAAIMGVEWFPWENISFSGEYRLGYNHSTGDAEVTSAGVSTTTDGPITSGFGLGSANSAALTLSVFF
jgi:hypothetical protein